MPDPTADEVRGYIADLTPETEQVAARQLDATLAETRQLAATDARARPLEAATLHYAEAVRSFVHPAYLCGYAMVETPDTGASDAPSARPATTGSLLARRLQLYEGANLQGPFKTLKKGDNFPVLHDVLPDPP